MEYKTDAVLDIRGNAIFNASVRVLTESKELATIYDANGNQVNNPLGTDATGEFSVAVPNGKYFYEISVNGKIYETRGPISFFDPMDNGAASIGYGNRTVSDKLGEVVSIADCASEVAGHAELNGAALMYPAGIHAGTAAPVNLHGAGYTRTLGERWQAGLASAPTPRSAPVLWSQKFSSSVQGETDGDGNWDLGGVYSGLIKISGDTFGSGSTSYAEYRGGSGDLIGHHARVLLTGGDARGFALWGYAKVTSPTAKRVAGAEISIANSAIEVEWTSEGTGDVSGIGALTSLNVGLADGDYGIHMAVRLPNKPSDDLKRPWTGIQFGQNSIKPADSNGNGEAIRIRGGSSVSGRYGGIALGDSTGAHNFTYGLRMAHATIADNAAVWMKLGHKIVWGSAKTATTWFRYGDTSGNFEFNGGAIQINGNKVVGNRVTGWATMTGTATRTSFNTDSVTLPQLAERVAALINDLKTQHGLIGD